MYDMHFLFHTYMQLAHYKLSTSPVLAQYYPSSSTSVLFHTYMHTWGHGTKSVSPFYNLDMNALINTLMCSGVCADSLHFTLHAGRP